MQTAKDGEQGKDSSGGRAVAMRQMTGEQSDSGTQAQARQVEAGSPSRGIGLDATGNDSSSSSGFGGNGVLSGDSPGRQTRAAYGGLEAIMLKAAGPTQLSASDAPIQLMIDVGGDQIDERAASLEELQGYASQQLPAQTQKTIQQEITRRQPLIASYDQIFADLDAKAECQKDPDPAREAEFNILESKRILKLIDRWLALYTQLGYTVPDQRESEPNRTTIPRQMYAQIEFNRQDLGVHIAAQTQILTQHGASMEKTWDPKAAEGQGSFVQGGAAYDPGLFDKDNNKKGYKAEDLGGNQKPSKENRFFTGVQATGGASNDNLKGGELSIDDLENLTIADITPIPPSSLVLYRILHGTFNQSWNQAKEHLASPETNVDAKKALMRKLWEYRQWHHDQVLEETQKQMAKDDLKMWPSAGSTTLTSDIDVNLKGNKTEYAVETFNTLFKKNERLPNHAWDFEPGVVYDVNVYAIDFMHNMKGVKVDAQDRPLADQSAAQFDHKIVEKEGKRDDRKEGGIGDQALREMDTANQELTALVKVRLYMSGAQWEQYKKGVRRPDADEVFKTVEEKYDEYIKTLTDEMARNSQAILDVSEEAEKSGKEILEGYAGDIAREQAPNASEGQQHARAENVLMGASNRVYERKLKEVYNLRTEVKADITQYNAMLKDASTDPTTREYTKEQIEMKLLELRERLADAGLYANEASLTDAVVHHGVVALQSGQEIQQSKGEGLNMIHEHMADTLKEIGRHGEEGFAHALFKSAKYFFRMTDAAKSMGFGYIGSVRRLYDAGWYITQELKGAVEGSEADDGAVFALNAVTSPDWHAAETEALEGPKGANQAAQQAPGQVPAWKQQVAARLAIQNVDELAGLVITAATDVENEYHAQMERNWGSPDELGATSQKKGGYNPNHDLPGKAP